MWIRSQGCCLLDHKAVKFCRRTLTFSRNKMALSSGYNYNSKTPVPMDPTTRRHIPEDRNRDVLSRRQDLKSHIQRAHQFVHTKSYRNCVAADCSRKVHFVDQSKQSASPDEANQRSTLAKLLGNKTDDGSSTPGRRNTHPCSQTRPDRPWELSTSGGAVGRKYIGGYFTGENAAGAPSQPLTFTQDRSWEWEERHLHSPTCLHETVLS
jgi:hypothetical protein